MTHYKSGHESQNPDQEIRRTPLRLGRIGGYALYYASLTTIGILTAHNVGYHMSEAESISGYQFPDTSSVYPDLSSQVEALTRGDGYITSDQHITCEDMPIVDNVWTGGKVYKIIADGQVVTDGYAHINKDVCEDYVESGARISSGEPLSNNDIISHLVISHEAGHLNSTILSEAEVQCHALQITAQRLEHLGVTEEYLQIARSYTEDFMIKMGDEYNSPECKINGDYDLTPSQFYNDIGDVWLPVS